MDAEHVKRMAPTSYYSRAKVITPIAPIQTAPKKVGECCLADDSRRPPSSIIVRAGGLGVDTGEPRDAAGVVIAIDAGAARG